MRFALWKTCISGAADWSRIGWRWARRIRPCWRHQGEQERQTQTALTAAQERLAALQAGVPESEARLRAAREALQAAHRSLTETRARHDALAQLQAKVAQRGEIGDWLKARNLAEAKPLWQAIQVEAGWETAVEAVLARALLGSGGRCGYPARRAAKSAAGDSCPGVGA